MRDGNPVALVADFEAFFTHSSALSLTDCSIIADGVRPRPTWQDTFAGQTSIKRQHLPCIQCSHRFNNHHNSSELLILTQVIYLITSPVVVVCVRVHACIYCMCQRGPSYACVHACVCVRSWPVAWRTSSAEQCSGLSLLFE